MLKRLLSRKPPGEAGPHDPWQSEARGELAPVARQLVILRPKTAYLEWLRRVDPACQQSLKDLRSDAPAYLVPFEEGDPQSAHAFVKAHFGRFFSQELSLWVTNSSRWPADRTWELFRLWFDIEVTDMVLDVASEP